MLIFASAMKSGNTAAITLFIMAAGSGLLSLTCIILISTAH